MNDIFKTIRERGVQMNDIFKTIRDQANLKKAESIRSGSGVSLRDQCAAASKKKMDGISDQLIDDMVDALLLRAAGHSLNECTDLVPELKAQTKSADESRKAILDAAVMSGQYLKATMRGSVKAIIDNLHVRVADTVSSIATEATISSLVSNQPRQLSEKQEGEN